MPSLNEAVKHPATAPFGSTLQNLSNEVANGIIALNCNPIELPAELLQVLSPKQLSAIGLQIIDNFNNSKPSSEQIKQSSLNIPLSGEMTLTPKKSDNVSNNESVSNRSKCSDNEQDEDQSEDVDASIRSVRQDDQD